MQITERFWGLLIKIRIWWRCFNLNLLSRLNLNGIFNNWLPTNYYPKIYFLNIYRYLLCSKQTRLLICKIEHFNIFLILIFLQFLIYFGVTLFNFNFQFWNTRFVYLTLKTFMYMTLCISLCICISLFMTIYVYSVYRNELGRDIST